MGVRVFYPWREIEGTSAAGRSQIVVDEYHHNHGCSSPTKVNECA